MAILAAGKFAGAASSSKVFINGTYTCPMIVAAVDPSGSVYTANICRAASVMT